MKWELIDFYHERAKVPGGWLVKVIEPVFHTPPFDEHDANLDIRIAIAFVPDAKHEWTLE